MIASPLVKYPGGKRWFVKHDEFTNLRNHLLKTHGAFIDPFLGGGSVPLALGSDPDLDMSGMVLSDVLFDVVNMYTMAKLCPLVFGVRLLDLSNPVADPKWTYYRRRDIFNSKELDPAERAACFVYLNKCGFNGLVRYNKKGKWNVPFGENRSLPNADHVHACNAAIRGSEIYVGGFLSTVERAGDGDVLYLDPPYHNTFTKYSGDSFTEDDQVALAQATLGARDRGAYVVAHNNDTPLIRELYSERNWRRVEAPERRRISCKGGGRGPVHCLIMVSK